MKTAMALKQGPAPQLMIDCFGCSREKLADNSFVCQLLESLPAKIGLEKGQPPHVFKYTGDSPDNSGVSGVVLTADSHISVHTFPGERHAFVDIFSRRDFDADRACAELLNMLEASGHQAVRLGHPGQY